MSQVSLRLGRNRAYIHQFVGRGIPKRLPGIARNQLAEILQIDEGQLVPPGIRWTASVRQSPSRSEAGISRPDTSHKDIPVLGTALSNDAASDFVFTGEVIDFIRCPPALAKAKGCFALRVVVDAMAPKFEPGNIVIIQSGRVPSANDYVVIELHSKEGALGAGFLRRLMAHAPDYIVCEQFNPHQKRELRIDDIKTLYRVVSTDELFGVSAF